MTRTSLVLVLCVAACSKSKDADKSGAATPAKSAESAAMPKPGHATPWSFDPAAVQAKLQGAWVVKDHGYLGSIEAWEVKGDQIKIWDAKANKETTAKLTIDAPCQYTMKDADGSSTTSHFVLDGDTLHLGLGDAGVKQGDTVVACMSNGVFVFASGGSGGCKFYTSSFGDAWSAEDATCSLATEFKASEKTYHYDGSMPAHGNVFASDQLWNNPAPARAASYDEAKTKAKS